MTREDAFEIWLPIIKMGVKSMPECSEALDMAIKALEQEPCEDAISRQAMHIELEKWITYGEYKYSNATKYLYDRIDRLPPVIPTEKVGRWIPVSERLPEKTDFYLIQHTRKYCLDEMAVAFYSVQEAHVDPNYTWEFETIADVQEVIAWMPLPERYRASPTGAERSEE